MARKASSNSQEKGSARNPRGNCPNNFPGEFWRGSFVDLLGSFPWKKQKIHLQRFQISTWEFPGQNPHCKDRSLTSPAATGEILRCKVLLAASCELTFFLWPLQSTPLCRAAPCAQPSQTLNAHQSSVATWGSFKEPCPWLHTKGVTQQKATLFFEGNAS